MKIFSFEKDPLVSPNCLYVLEVTNAAQDNGMSLKQILHRRCLKSKLVLLIVAFDRFGHNIPLFGSATRAYLLR